jgi:hypothetical protein
VGNFDERQWGISVSAVITGFLKATQPLNDWLIAYVGATTLPQRRR